jgi:hypothetical protein
MISNVLKAVKYQWLLVDYPFIDHSLYFMNKHVIVATFEVSYNC